jgi:hypothetical protein
MDLATLTNVSDTTQRAKTAFEILFSAMRSFVAAGVGG